MTFNYSLKWIHQYPNIVLFLSCLAAPLSYYSGAKIGPKWAILASKGGSRAILAPFQSYEAIDLGSRSYPKS